VEPLRTAVPVPAPALPISTPTLVIYLYTNTIFWLKQKAQQNYGNQNIENVDNVEKKLTSRGDSANLECLFFL